MGEGVCDAVILALYADSGICRIILHPLDLRKSAANPGTASV